MTEEKWLVCDDPDAMLMELFAKASERKLRLFACACCRLVWPLLRDERSRRAVEVAERYADGQVPWEEVVAANYETIAAYSRREARTPQGEAADAARSTLRGSLAMWAAATSAAERTRAAAWVSAREDLRPVQCDLIRDIFGNPFRDTPAIDPAWLTPKVLTIAKAIYDERAFVRMPDLGEAIAAEVCSDPGILDHCRSRSDHVRGCWLVDTLLGRS